MKKISFLIGLVAAGMMGLAPQSHGGVDERRVFELENSLKAEVSRLLDSHCRESCLEVQVKAVPKIMIEPAEVDPGFDEMTEKGEESLSIEKFDVQLLASQALSPKAKDFLKSYIEYLGQRYQAPVEVAFSSIDVPPPKKAKNFLPLMLLGGALLAGVLLFSAWRRSRHQKDSREWKELKASEMELSKAVSGSSYSTPQRISGDSLPLFVSENLENVRQVLQRWCLTREGFSKALQLLVALQPSMRSSLKGVLGEVSKEELREEYLRSVGSGEEELKQIAAELKREIEMESLLSLADIKEQDHFHFLQVFDAIKIVHLIKDEEAHHKALVMMQLDPEKRGIVYSALTAAEKRAVSVELGKLTSIPWKDLHSLASRLSMRASQLSEIELREVSGFDALVSIAERSDDPARFISEMAQVDLKLAHRLRSHVVSLDLIEWLEDHEVKLFLSRLKRDDLVALLLGKWSAQQKLILSKLPDPMVEYVHFHLEPEFRKKMTPVQIRRGEEEAYRALRQMFQEGLLNLEEIHKRKTMWEHRQVITDTGDRSIEAPRPRK